MTVLRALCIRGSSPDIYSLYSLPHTNQPHNEMQFSVVAQQEFPKSKKDWGGGVRWAMGIKVHVPNSYPLVFFFRPSYTTCLPALHDGNHSSKMSLCCVSKKSDTDLGGGVHLEFQYEDDWSVKSHSFLFLLSFFVTKNLLLNLLLLCTTCIQSHYKFECNSFLM